MEKIIIGLVGEAASGKGTVATYLKEKYGAQVHAFSASMKDCVARLKMPLSRENLTKFSTAMRQTFGEDLFAKVVAKECLEDTQWLTIVDGIRLEADMVELKKLPHFHLFYVTAPVEIRWQRARARGEKANEANMTLEEFKAEELFGTELAIKEIGAGADFSVDNSVSKEELYANIAAIFEDIKAGGYGHQHPHRA